MESFIENVRFEVFDEYQTDKWILQDPRRFDSVEDMFAYALRFKARGYQIRFSYSWLKENLGDNLMCGYCGADVEETEAGFIHATDPTIELNSAPGDFVTRNHRKDQPINPVDIVRNEIKS